MLSSLKAGVISLSSMGFSVLRKVPRGTDITTLYFPDYTWIQCQAHSRYSAVSAPLNRNTDVKFENWKLKFQTYKMFKHQCNEHQNTLQLDSEIYLLCAYLCAHKHTHIHTHTHTHTHTHIYTQSFESHLLRKLYFTFKRFSKQLLRIKTFPYITSISLSHIRKYDLASYPNWNFLNCATMIFHRYFFPVEDMSKVHTLYFIRSFKLDPSPHTFVVHGPGFLKTALL